MEHDKAAMDRLLAYRNLLCAEDHIDELRSSADAETLKKLDTYKHIIEGVRDQVMPPEANADYHCVVKHLSASYEAMREVAKTSGKDEDDANAIIVRDILLEFLELLWGYKPEKCERCKSNEHDDES